MTKSKMIHLIFFITLFGNLKGCRDKVLWCDCRRSQIVPAVMSYALCLQELFGIFLFKHRNALLF